MNGSAWRVAPAVRESTDALSPSGPPRAEKVSSDDVALFEKAMQSNPSLAERPNASSKERTQAESLDETAAPDASSARHLREGVDESRMKRAAAEGKGNEEPSEYVLNLDFVSRLFAFKEGETTGCRTTAPVPSATTLTGEALDALTVRILVSVSDGSRGEVRLYIGDPVLNNTEFRLSRDAQGLLTVSVVTADENAFQTMVSSKDALVERLEAAEKKPVLFRMDKEMNRSGEGDDSDARRRSRGWFSDDDERD